MALDEGLEEGTREFNEFVQNEIQSLTRKKTVEVDESYKALEDALKYEGETMGHCVGGYCPSVAEGRSKIYSLRDKKGQPHVTIEVQPGRPWNERSGIFYDYPELENTWAAYSKEVNQAAREKGVERNPNYIIGYPDWLKSNAPDVFEKYADVFAPPPEEIVQIKGKGNKAPKEEYLPAVQDFVRSGNWGRIGDLQNTGLVQLPDKRLITKEQFEEGVQRLTGEGGGPGSEWFMNVMRGDPSWWEESKGAFEGFSRGGQVRGYAAGGMVSGANFPTDDFDPDRIDSIVAELHAMNAV
jgi:hypothetical protein